VETARVFLGLPLGPCFAEEIARFLPKIQSQMPHVKWIKPGNAHVTLHFFGNLTRVSIAEASSVIRPLARQQKPMVFGLEGAGAFPHPSRPRVVWLGLTGDVPRLTQWQEMLDESLNQAGFPREDRPFHPHVTLGRTGKDRKPGGLPALEFPKTDLRRVDEIILFRSQLTPYGPVYEPIETFPLQGA